MPGLHQSALEQLAKCGSDESGSRTLTAADGESIPLSPVELRCGSFADPNENISDADLCFVFSTCFDEETMGMVGKFIGRQCKPGTIVITIGETVAVFSRASSWHNALLRLACGS